MQSLFKLSLGLLSFVIITLVTPRLALAQIFTVTPDLYSTFTPSPTPAEARGVTGPVGVLDRPRADLQPPGVWAGGQHFLPSVSASSVYNSNIFATESSPVTDAVSHLRPELNVDNGTRLISYHFNVYGDFVNYLNHSGLDNANYGTALDVVGDLSSTFRLESHTALTYGHMDPANFELPVANAAVSHLPATQSYIQQLSGTRDIGRWALGLTGGYTRSEFENVAISGVTLQQSQLNSNVFTVTPRVTYDITPLLRGIAEGEYTHEADAEGTLNASTYTASTGLDFELRQLIRGNFTVGYSERAFDETQFGSNSGITYGLKLAWYPSERVTVSATGQQQFTSTIVSGVGNAPAAADVTTMNLQVDYDLSRQVVLSGIASYEDDAFTGSTRNDQIPSVGVNFLYLLNRDWEASAQSRLIKRNSTQAGFSYEQIQFGIGLKLRL